MLLHRRNRPLDVWRPRRRDRRLLGLVERLERPRDLAEGRVLRRVAGRERFRRLAMHERQRRRNRVPLQGFVDRPRSRRRRRMPGAIVAVHALHAPARPGRDELGRCAFGLVLADRAVCGRHLDVRNRLPRVIRGDVLDPCARVRVPVDAADRRQAPFAPADVHLQVRHRPGIRLVIAELDHAAQDLAVIAAGEVAALTCLARRHELVRLGGDRAGIGPERDRHELPGARRLGRGEARRARRDVAVHAARVDVRPLAVRAKLRLHRVADLRAERHRVHVFDAAVRRQRHDHDVRHRQGKRRGR